LTSGEKLSIVKGKKSKPEEIQAISGATITTKAVTEAVQAAIDAAAELMEKEGVEK
jgi:electron transport complex protein RnfG